MNPELITALVLFAFVSTITPGPNNLMLMTSGANFGFKRTIPHMLGICLGVVVMILLVGAGLMQIFDRVVWSYDLLKLACVCFMGFLAIKIVRTEASDLKGRAKAKPFSFLQAALFQWVNPKAWTMALAAITLYSPERSLDNVMMIALAFALVNLPSISLWVILGRELRVFLTSAFRMKIFNTSMACLLLASLYPVLH